MPQIEIDLSALEARLANDSVLASLEQEKVKFRQEEEERKTQYNAKITACRAVLKEKRKAKALLLKEIRHLNREIERFKGACRFRSIGMRRIENRINLRRRHLKFQEVKRATAAARKKVSKLISL